MQALHDVVQAGYVRYIGMSSCHAWQCTLSQILRWFLVDKWFLVHAMQSQFNRMNLMMHEPWWIGLMIDYAINNKLTPFISMQNHYNLLYREEEREMMPTLKVRIWVCL